MTTLVLAAAYLLGTFPTGVLLARAKGVDLRSVGSGNIGASNAARHLGRTFGVLTLLGDLGKGALAAALAKATLHDVRWIAVAGLAAVFGHVFPIWLRFRGGKGVATSLGVMLVLVPWSGLAGLTAYVLVYAKTRYSSAGSLAGATVVAATTPVFTRDRAMWALAGVLLLFIVVRHRENIRRLLRGEEVRT